MIDLSLRRSAGRAIPMVADFAARMAVMRECRVTALLGGLAMTLAGEAAS